MKNRLIFFLTLMIAFLISCQPRSKKAVETWEVALLHDSSVLAFASWLDQPPVINGKQIKVTIVDSPEQMQEILIHEQADIALLPLINAAFLYNKGVNYQIGGCPTWGNLYMIEKENTPEEDASIYISGAGTTSDLLARFYCEENSLTYSYNYSFATTDELLKAIYTGKVNRAVLMEPFVSMVLEKEPSFKIAADLNKPGKRIAGFPQTALLYKDDIGIQKIIDDIVKAFCTHLNQFPEETIHLLEKKNIFPEGTLTPEIIRRCKIEYHTAQQAEPTIYSFLEMIHTYDPTAIGGKIPDKSFIYKTP